MACCGDRRRSLTQAPRRPTAPPPPAVKTSNTTSQQPRAQTAGVGGAVPVRYVGSSRTVVLGSVTRRYYAFAPGGAVQSVDARDAAVLLRSVGFQRA
jgi:hypothetical protein